MSITYYIGFYKSKGKSFFIGVDDKDIKPRKKYARSMDSYDMLLGYLSASEEMKLKKISNNIVIKNWCRKAYKLFDDYKDLTKNVKPLSKQELKNLENRLITTKIS